MKYLQWLRHLVNPFAIGIYISLFFIACAWQFYSHQSLSADLKNSDSSILKLLHRADQISHDLRLQSRGQRYGSKDVALLAVDEKTLQAVGSWPIPRDTYAKAISNAIKHGAKVISFDATFPESSSQHLKTIFQRIDRRHKMQKKVKQDFISEIRKRDPDLIFSQAIKKHADHLVLGTFFEKQNWQMTNLTYENICHNLIYEQSAAFQTWDNEESFLIVHDPFERSIPDLLSEIYKEHFKTIEEKIRSTAKPPKTSLEKIKLRNRIEEKKTEYCLSWLKPDKDEQYAAIAELWDQIRAEDEDIEEATFDQFVKNLMNDSLRNSTLVASNWTMNHPTLAQGAKNTGFFNAVQDSDGAIRRSRLFAREGSHYMPSISLKAFLLANNYNAEITIDKDLEDPTRKIVTALNITDGDSGDNLFEIPVDQEGNLIINYAGRQKMFPHISMAELINNKKDMLVEQRIIDGQKNAEEHIKVKKSEFLKDKILILGATAVGVYDLRVTPFEKNYPGAETHVNVIDNLLRRDFLYRHPNEEIYMVAILFLLGLFMSFALSRLGALSGIILTISVLATVLGIDYYFFQQGIIISIVFPLVTVLLQYVVTTFYKYFTEERNKKELRQVFSKYVSPAIVDEILEDPSNIELGGRKENVTVFFSDIRGFTTISEKLDPHELTNLLNSYLTPMTDLVFENSGTLDKYMGDAIMAFFGAPISYPDHPARACRCALQHIEKLKELQKEYEEQGLPMLDIGIGLNTGECNVGNMGSETVRSYTVMGDSVNLGARLEGINKQYGTRIIISEFTYEDVKDQFVCREIDLVRVKGKLEPVKIYELVAEGEADPEKTKIVNSFKEGYKLYHAQKFKEALLLFEGNMALDEEEGPSQLYITRCQEFIATPPPQDWDGVFTMTTK